MRIRGLLFSALVLMFVALPASAQMWGRGERPHDGACFYRDSNFRGDYFCVKSGERLASLPPGFNDRIRSIRVFGDAAVRVFNDENFRGVHTLFRGDDARNLHDVRVPDNHSKNWADRISSIAVFRRDRDEWRDFDWREHGHDHDR
ncbi:MAG TPA: peptidase inhibitor family I36 protein [candidate division Zixibacteria bacterium]|nr:peptidase inhibitor family I36 protein [candidate division Zixibacteria bacterium]